MEKQIFISYCWANETIIDEIDGFFSGIGITLIRDKRDTEYKDSFKKFMKKVRTTDYVLMVISDEYLKSKNCMNEVLEVIKDENYKERIFPIVLDNAKPIHESAGVLKYCQYWGNELKRLKESIKEFDPEKIISILNDDVKIIRDIENSIVDFIKLISDLKYIPLDELKQMDYIPLLKEMGLYNLKPKKIKYDIIEQEDVSHHLAKRYSTKILIDKTYTKEEIKIAIKEITEAMKEDSYQRNEQLKKSFSYKKADIVWIFVAHSLSDLDTINWRCKTQWINPKLIDEAKPQTLNVNDKIDDIEIEWNNEYEKISSYLTKTIVTKGKFLELIDEIIFNVKKLTDPLIKKFDLYLQNKSNITELENYTADNEIKIYEFYSESGNLPFAPFTCRKYDEIAQSFFAIAHNMFLYYSPENIDTWSKDNKKYLLKSNIDDYKKLLDELEEEKNKI